MPAVLRSANRVHGRIHGNRIPRSVNRPFVGQCFDIELERRLDGWAVRIPEIDAVTHADRRSTAELAARRCIADRTGIPIGYVVVLVVAERD
jgi:hypothetical protein